MAQFQETRRRENTVPRRALSKEDIEFLLNLQTELNTQDTMGNADPRFWVIRQTEEFPAPNTGEEPVIIDNEGNIVARNVEELLQCIAGCDEAKERHFTFQRTGDYAWLLKDNEQEYTASSVDEIFEFADYCTNRYQLAWSEERGVNVPDTLFLTHKDCEDHLRRYGYNYKPDAHAYAMTADRSPRFEQLIKILQSVDWKTLAERL